MTDPIADMLTRIRNAQAVHKPEVVLPYSSLKHRIADILFNEGYVSQVEEAEDNGRKALRIVLKYVEKEPAIHSLQRVSTPGRRVYVNVKRLPYVFENLGCAIVSTSKGLMTNKEARAKKLGGEVLCKIF